MYLSPFSTYQPHWLRSMGKWRATGTALTNACWKGMGWLLALGPFLSCLVKCSCNSMHTSLASFPLVNRHPHFTFRHSKLGVLFLNGIIYKLGRQTAVPLVGWEHLSVLIATVACKETDTATSCCCKSTDTTTAAIKWERAVCSRHL